MPTERSYAPGDEVTAAGFTASVPEHGSEYRAYLAMTPDPPDEVLDWQDLGPVTIEATGRGGYLATRVFLRFTVPDGFGDGVYWVSLLDEEGRLFGDLMGMILFVGNEPEGDLIYEWPVDDPLVADLPADAVLAGPEFYFTVGELRAGRIPPPAPTADAAPVDSGPTATTMGTMVAATEATSADPKERPPFASMALIVSGAAALLFAVWRRDSTSKHLPAEARTTGTRGKTELERGREVDQTARRDDLARVR